MKTMTKKEAARRVARLTAELRAAGFGDLADDLISAAHRRLYSDTPLAAALAVAL